MILRLNSIGILARVVRTALAMLVVAGMSLPLMHVHTAQAAGHVTEASSATATDHHAAADHSMPSGADHQSAGLECCIHHAPTGWPGARATLRGRVAGKPLRATVSDDLVKDGALAHRLEKPPRRTV